METIKFMSEKPLGNVYRIASASEDRRTRDAALYLLIKGVVFVDEGNVDTKDLFVAAGCESEYIYRDDTRQWVYKITCDGAKECYSNDDLY